MISHLIEFKRYFKLYRRYKHYATVTTFNSWDEDSFGKINFADLFISE